MELKGLTSFWRNGTALTLTTFFRLKKASMVGSAGTKIDIFSRDGIFGRKWKFGLIASSVGDFSSRHLEVVDSILGLCPASYQIISF